MTEFLPTALIAVYLATLFLAARYMLPYAWKVQRQARQKAARNPPKIKREKAQNAVGWSNSDYSLRDYCRAEVCLAYRKFMDAGEPLIDDARNAFEKACRKYGPLELDDIVLLNVEGSAINELLDLPFSRAPKAVADFISRGDQELELDHFQNAYPRMEYKAWWASIECVRGDMRNPAGHRYAGRLIKPKTVPVPESFGLVGDGSSGETSSSCNTPPSAPTGPTNK